MFMESRQKLWPNPKNYGIPKEFIRSLCTSSLNPNADETIVADLLSCV